MLMASFVNSLSCSWALSTTAAQLRVVMTVSYGVPPLTTLMKMANMASALMNVSLPSGSLFVKAYTICLTCSCDVCLHILLLKLVIFVAPHDLRRDVPYLDFIEPDKTFN